MKILLVEDEKSTRTLIETALAINHTVEVAEDGRSALAWAEQFDYDLLLLDIDIPELDGISVCKHLRTQGCQIPILLLTAKDGVSDRVRGLDAGADDYMIKPFHLPELLARIRALWRRGRSTASSRVTWGALQLDCPTREIRYEEQPLRLTPKEHSILELLLLNPQRIFSRAAIIDRLWELGEPPTESAISSHIKAIRQKLKTAGASQDLIETMYGFGYRLRPALPSPLNLPAPATSAPLQVPLPNPQPDIAPDAAAAVMDELWERFKDSFSVQLDVLDRVVNALQHDSLTTDLQQEARHALHKLVGSLGMYGFPQGSVLAKQIEAVIHPDLVLAATDIQQIAHWVIALRQELSHPPQPVAFSAMPAHQLPKILVVDHDAALSEQLAAEATARSLDLHTATNPTAAQLLLKSRLPDVILLDLTFSDRYEDGLVWLKAVRLQYPQIPVLVFTERDRLSDRLAVSRLWIQQFLPKPATTEQIFQAIARTLARPTPPEPRVLIVDDDPGVLVALSAMLTPWGVTVSTLNNSEHFWDVLAATAPNLVLLDLEMPGVTGLELCQVVRQDVEWGDLPILVVTAHTDVDSLQQAFAAGADDFINKPVMGPELVTRVLSRIGRSRLQSKIGRLDGSREK